MDPLKIGLVIASQDIWGDVQACLRDLPVRVVIQNSTIGDWSLFLEQLDRLRPEALLIDITGSSKNLDEITRGVKALSAPPMLIALSNTADPETILAAVRAGANEYLYPPFDAGLHRALERISAERRNRRDRSRPRARTLGFLSAKGGCGATTIVCHIAAELQRSTTQDILLADFDLDSGIVGFLMKVKTPYSLLDAVQNIHRLDLSYWKALISNGQPHLEVIPAPPAGAIRGALDPDPFRRVLNFVQSAYDWVLVDLGRNLSLLSRSLLDDVDDVFLISTLDLPALHQAKQITHSLLESGHDQKRLHLVLNRMPKRSDFTTGEVQRILGLPVYATLPNDYPELFEAYAHGNLLPPGCELGQQLANLTMKITGIQKAQRGRSRSAFSF